ncbi:MAG: polyketide cyclase, partial [Planctomycetota bacterium]
MAKFIGIVLVLVIVLGFVVPSVFLSSSFAAERATTIAAEPASIAAEVNDFNTWESWTPWNLEYDATMKRTITGEPGAVG